MKKRLTPILLFLGVLLFVSCSKSSGNKSAPMPVKTPEMLYFPPITGNAWDTVSAATLKWNVTNLNNLYPYLQSEGTKAFIILKDGKIVTEKYFGTFTADSLWYWASAGKTMTGFLVGIAQKQGLLNINDLTSKYLGTGWTSEPLAKENMITIKNQLSMTTGLDDGVGDPDCTLPGCLIYKADAGTRWAYHNAAYTLLGAVVAKASGMSHNAYFEQQIRDKIGMNGLWVQSHNSNDIYYSNARSMARFGLLLLNKGTWDKTGILTDTAYFHAQTNTSQTINLGYGYLTWLNGKTSYMLPQTQLVFPGFVIPNGPADMYMALGKNDQKIYVVPSQHLVVIRMGNSAGGVKEAESDFDNTLWGKLQRVIGF
jgi:CubicO group peptidase (beta-lactamase class C family)